MRPFKIPNNVTLQDTTIGREMSAKNKKSVAKHHGTRNEYQNEKSVTIKKRGLPSNSGFTLF